MSILQNGKRFDDPIAQGFEECGLEFADRSEHIAREVAVMRALFGDDEIVDLAEPLPDLHELRGQQLPEERADTYAREIIAATANRGSAGRIITVFRVIKRLLHEPGKRDLTMIADLVANQSNERRVVAGHFGKG